MATPAALWGARVDASAATPRRILGVTDMTEKTADQKPQPLRCNCGEAFETPQQLKAHAEEHHAKK